jgi:hypothetical protein
MGEGLKDREVAEKASRVWASSGVFISHAKLGYDDLSPVTV